MDENSMNEKSMNEKRKFKRRNLAFDVKFNGKDGRTENSMSRNISAGDIVFPTREPLHVGDSVALSISRPDLGRLDMQGHVTRTDETKRGYLTALRFIPSDSTAQGLSGFLSSSGKSSDGSSPFMPIL